MLEPDGNDGLVRVSPAARAEFDDRDVDFLTAVAHVLNGAVEELLRYLTVIQLNIVRGALEDIELHGQLIKAGASVCISLPAANRDPTTFTDPDTLNLCRSASGHLAFGHGFHQCIGQQLARMEMRTAFPALLRRFPDLALAVPFEEVPFRAFHFIYGLQALPVTW